MRLLAGLVVLAFSTSTFGQTSATHVVGRCVDGIGDLVLQDSDGTFLIVSEIQGRRLRVGDVLLGALNEKSFFSLTDKQGHDFQFSPSINGAGLTRQEALSNLKTSCWAFGGLEAEDEHRSGTAIAPVVSRETKGPPASSLLEQMMKGGTQDLFDLTQISSEGILTFIESCRDSMTKNYKAISPARATAVCACYMDAIRATGELPDAKARETCGESAKRYR